MKKNINMLLLALVIIFSGIMIAGFFFPAEMSQAVIQAKEKAWKVFINKKESKQMPVKNGDKEYMPLNFPVQEGEQVYEVKLKSDPKTKTMNIEIINKKRTVRGSMKCNACGGTGDCQACYPAGSGRNIQGDACPTCNGTGDCFICNGAGSY